MQSDSLILMFSFKCHRGFEERTIIIWQKFKRENVEIACSAKRITGFEGIYR